MTTTVTIKDFPAPPAGSVFKLVKVETITQPHPYCIGVKHVAMASDHHGGILDTAAIADAEKHGAVCDICREQVRHGGQERILTYDEHESLLTLFIRVPQNKDLNAVPGLHQYLLSIKEPAAKLGIGGFAFPRKGQ